MIKSQDKLEYEIGALSFSVAKNDTTWHLKSIRRACGARINLCEHQDLLSHCMA